MYREPGKGAIEFAAGYVAELSREEALAVIARLLKGEIHDSSDKRVKRCDYCGYWWRDKSLRNTKRTCCDKCKCGIKTLQRRDQRARADLLNPKKQAPKENKYIYWLEYPFWVPEYDMLKQSWKYEAPYAPAKVERIDAAKQRDELMGGKRKPKRVVPYNGDELETGKVRVKFTESDRKPGKVVVSRMSREEVAEYFSSNYSAHRLRMERLRAKTYFKWRQ